ncbi:MAG: hypothetical protein NC418_10180 [Muribaculaceae bacterium]|nr:hypothetical protein [Muribaculaceae bacterium]
MKILNRLKHIVACAALAMCAAATLSARVPGAYYGTNYTVPFAHAYRALGELGVDRGEAIDRDVYHMALLGFNGFRLHLWDVELSDGEGNLLDNEHLALLDSLITSLESRGISIILTAQTNFGNGYPERNTDPNGAFSYRFAKCRVHDEPAAQDAQERYLRALVARVNPLTGKSLADDPAILAIEINNEPCHSGSHSEIAAYIDRMAAALRDAGWKKDIIYNVSHNLWRTSAFYRADIDGTTYQWYPTGLVKGSRRRGNFLPVLDSYDIPFDTVAGYASQPKLIYEYDPADVLETYLYPAAARTFRKEGFDWVTQFAYDPIDMARFNTEYQTHFLNLAYTPGKAIGMAIAAEVMRRTPAGMDYGKYPADTIFGDFTVSARRNLAMLNDGRLYYHTNSTADAPRNGRKLSRIAAVGSSPVVSTDGTGAYFIDKLDANTWRLELMPDVVLTADPFARPSLSREVAKTIDAPIALSLRLPGLKEGFAYEGKRGSGKAVGLDVSLMPGVYLIGNKPAAFAKWPADRIYDSERKLRVGEYVMPPISGDFAPIVVHTPAVRAPKGSALPVEATVLCSEPVDSVMLYPADVDFWRDDNKIYPMTKTGKYSYSATVEPQGEKERFAYYIVAYSGGRAVTFPSGEVGAPLDWDFAAGRSSVRDVEAYSTDLLPSDAPVALLGGSLAPDDIDRGTASISRYVADITRTWPDSKASTVLVELDGTDIPGHIKLGLVNGDGFTYSADVVLGPDGKGTVDLASLRPAPTLLIPEPFPSFLSRSFEPEPQSVTPLLIHDIERVVLSLPEASADRLGSVARKCRVSLQ